MTPPIVDLTRRGAELDLDSPASGGPRRQRWRGPAIATVAALLIGAGAGATLRTLTADAPPPVLPQAELSFVEAHLDGDTKATLGVTVHNAGRLAVTVASFEADGIHAGHVSQPLHVNVPSEGTSTVRITVDADCRKSIDATPLHAQLRMTDGTTTTAVPSRQLGSAGGLCRQVRAALPDGWWDPWPGVKVEVSGETLRLTLPPLGPGAILSGVWVGQTILTYPNPPKLVGDRYLPITFAAPGDCILDGERRLPTGLRILIAGTPTGLQDRYVVVGPDLARWLLRRC